MSQVHRMGGAGPGRGSSVAPPPTLYTGAPWCSIAVSHNAGKFVPGIFSLSFVRNAELDESAAILIQAAMRGFLSRRKSNDAKQCGGAEMPPTTDGEDQVVRDTEGDLPV